MAQNSISDDNPFKQTEEEILRDAYNRTINRAFFALDRIERKLDDIFNAVEANTVNIEILEEAVSKLIDIPTRKVAIWYDHKEAKLWVNNRFYIQFERTEPELMSQMFYKNSGQPKKKKLQCSEVAEKLTDKNTHDIVSVKAVHSRLKRIQDKLDKRLLTQGILVIKTKEFYFSSAVTDN